MLAHTVAFLIREYIIFIVPSRKKNVEGTGGKQFYSFHHDPVSCTNADVREKLEQV